VFLLLASCLPTASLLAQQAALGDADFYSRLQDLYQSHYSDIKPEQLIAQYEQLIERYSDYPPVVKAMYQLARFYDDKDISLEKSIFWYHQAIHFSEDSSSEEIRRIWGKANIGLARILRWRTGVDKNVREAGSILQAVATKCQDQPLMLAEVKLGRVMQCFAEENYSRAEHHCRQLLDWDKHHADQSLNSAEKKALEVYQSWAATYLLQRLPYGPGTKKGKIAWLKRFSSDFADRQWLQEAAQPIYHQISGIEDPPPPILELASRKETGRMFFLACNVLAVLVLGVLVLRNRILNRREASGAA